MTREEALELMKGGHKITHKYFTSSEYFYMKFNSIIAEDGVDFSKLFFTTDMYADGWSIFEEK
ncbi:hypothetical protein BI036_gp208 [Morganella phage vB_MmoM_MP1]|uniref:Uncharacterized protein n=1 Tax=Morganella phage vB_MmoM_MP1 TaxID=1852628 RepID=A0A192YCN9_9CAUD|nr:hypothetical protein BI036_gp208 [Morganella phage vB_MmoM_MP1]ANM46651.1 hypothetical protein MP1_gp0186 [Morganella phage vB_MmoM_MP1]